MSILPKGVIATKFFKMYALIKDQAGNITKLQSM
jgi:hypothetical protein